MDNKDERQYRKKEDIEKGVDDLVKEISDETKNMEEGVKKLLTKEEDTLQNAKEQLDTIVVTLNNKQLSFEEKVKTKLNSASEALKDSVSLLTQNYELVKKEYLQSLTPSLLLLLVLFYFYDPIAAFLPWINFTVYGIKIIKLGLVVIASLNFWISFQRLNKSFRINHENLEKNREIINKTEPLFKEVNISQEKFKDTSLSFSRIKELLSTLTVTVGKATPLLNQTLEELTLFVRYKRMVESFEFALKYYGVLDDKKFCEELKKVAPANAQIIDEEQVWETIIIEKILAKLDKKENLGYGEIMRLLYQEHAGLDTKNTFRQISDSENALSSFAEILISSKRLVQPPENIVYNRQDIVSTLKMVGVFDLSEINNLLTRTLRQLEYLTAYVEFLRKNNLKPAFEPTIEFVINESREGEEDFEKQLVTLSRKIGKKIFDKIDTLPNEFREGFTCASISIKFHNEMSLKKYACEISAEDEATAVIKAYYEKSKEKGGETVLLAELVDNLPLIRSMYDKREEDREFKFLKSQLKEGKWFDSSDAYLKELIEKNNRELGEQISKNEKFTVLQEIVKKTFRNVNIATIDKAIDAQMFSAYVIMLYTEVGHLAKLVDKLSKRDLEAQPPEKRWEYKSGEDIKNIRKEFGLEPTYDFVKFSDSTRIGVLDKGTSFVEFKDKFLNDLSTILSKTNSNENFKGGVVIYRITPSKYSFGILDEEKLPENVNLTTFDIAHYISRLAIDHVSTVEQAIVIKFEKDVDLLKIVDTKSIYELIRIENEGLKTKEETLLKSEKLRQSVMKKLKESGTGNFKSLALDLGKKRIDKLKLSNKLNNVFESYFSAEPSLRINAKSRADVLSKRFLDVLEQLALIYEME